MKKAFLPLVLNCVLAFGIYAQNNVSGPMGVYYSAVYAGATTISNGGSILVGNGGNWSFGGSITSADKGNDNAPNSVGRSEKIVFSGAGTYSNATNNAGGTGYIIDGYAGVVNQPAGFTLPLGSNNTAYPVIVPSGITAAAAYFAGSGSTQNTAVTGTSASAVEYSPYIDMDNVPAGTYTFSYPAGFAATPYSYILESGNSSASGTSASTSYNLVQDVSTFSSSANSSLVSTSQSYGATQIYFATSSAPLPVSIGNFTATLKNGEVLLKWVTYTETKNKKFVVQSSTNGKDFDDIGSVNTLANNGESTATLNYSFTDKSPVAGAVNYYQLLQEDLDGTQSLYNHVVQIETGNENKLSVYPVPAHGSININGLSAADVVVIISVDGHIMNKFTASGQTQQLNISNLPAGVYFLKRYTKTGDNATVKFIVK